MPSQPIILILGAGPRIGTSLTSYFSTLNYKIALASRSSSNSLLPSGHLSLRADFSNPSCIPLLFTTIHSHFQSFPNVVIYNAGSFTVPSDETSVLSVKVEDVKKDLEVNVVAPYVAAQEAVKAWEKMGDAEGKKVFIYTGNISNTKIVPVPLMLSIGMGKSAAAAWIGLADGLYKGKGYR